MADGLQMLSQVLLPLKAAWDSLNGTTELPSTVLPGTVLPTTVLPTTVLPSTVLATTVLPTTVADHYTTSVQQPSTTFPTTPRQFESAARAAPAPYTDKAELLARAIEDGAADRTVFYITLSLCLLQLLIVLGIRFARNCACKSTLDGSATSLLKDESVKPTAEEQNTLRTARETRGEKSRRR